MTATSPPSTTGEAPFRHAFVARSAIRSSIETRWPPSRYGEILGTALAIAGFVFGLLLIAGMSWRTDAAVYWLADLSKLYGGREGEPLAFLYSPAFAQAMAPLHVIPLETFVLVWRITELAILTLVARSLTLPLLLIAWPVGGELFVGQTHLILAGVILLTRRFPGLWAAVILTKPTLVVGLAYYVGKRDWRGLWLASGATAAVTAVSFVIASNLWFDWIRVLAGSQPMTWEAIAWPLAVRLPAAALLAYLAGARQWNWLLPLAAMLALPTFWWVGLSMATASLFDLWGADGLRAFSGRVEMRKASRSSLAR